MSTWNGIRNKLESDYLCPALRGRIQYFATSYWESHDQTGRAAIRLDGVEVLRSNYYAYEQNYWNRYQALRREGVGEDDPKAPFRMAHGMSVPSKNSFAMFSASRMSQAMKST